MYRKINEKSRSWNHKSVFLFSAALVLLMVFLTLKLFIREAPTAPQRTELLIQLQSETLFDKDAVDKLIREFEEQKPEFEIKLVTSSPDIIFFDESQFRELEQQDALISLNHYMRAETAAGQRAVPLVSFMDLLFYNIQLLQNAGFDRPPKTRDEFLACVKAARDPGYGEEIYGSALGLKENDPLALTRDIFSWIWADGASLQKDGKPWFGSRTSSDVIGFLGKLNQEGALSPGTFSKTGADRLNEFAQGRIALLIASSREIQPLRKIMGPAAFGVTSIPGSPLAGKSSLELSSIYAGISSDCTRPDEAWSFLVFLTEKAPALAASLGAAPGSLPGMFPHTGAFPGDYIKEDPLYSKVWDIFEASEIIQGFAGSPLRAELEQTVREELRAFFDKDLRPADTAAAIQKRWDAL